MNTFIENTLPPLSFQYGGKPLAELAGGLQIEKSRCDKEAFIEHTWAMRLDDGLLVTTTLKEYTAFGACFWLTTFENAANADSLVLSEVRDCCVSLALPADEPMPQKGCALPARSAKIITMEGSNLSHDDFCAKQQYILVIVKL